MSGGNHDRKPESAARLLGGYSAGNLTEQEKQTLFEAALRDQSLFDELMDEHALKEALDEPGAKELLLAALPARRPSFAERCRDWLATPYSWGAAGVVAAAAALVMVVYVTRPAPRPGPAVATVAKDMQAVELPRATQRPPQGDAGPRASNVFQAPEQPKMLSQARSRPPALPPPPALSGGTPSIRANLEELKVVPGSPLPVLAPPAGQAAETQSDMAGGPLPATAPAPATALSEEPRPAALKSEVAELKVGAAAQPLSLAYTVLRQGAAGREPMPAGETLRRGDSFWLRFTPNRDGYLAVYQRDSRGRTIVVAPGERVERGREAMVPSRGSFAALAEPQSFVVTFAENPNDLGAPPAGGAIVAFRQGAVGISPARRAKAGATAGRDAVAAPAEMANQPSGSPATAATPAATTVVVEITVPAGRD